MSQAALMQEMHGAGAVQVRRDLQRVLGYCAAWSVPVVNTSPRVTITHRGPISGGIHWPSRTIVFPLQANVIAVSASALVHELSHVLVNEDPNHVDEVESPMLALDYVAHRRLRLATWSLWMTNYLVAGRSWPEHTTRERHRLFCRSFEAAASSGLINEAERQTFKRIKSSHG